MHTFVDVYHIIRGCSGCFFSSGFRSKMKLSKLLLYSLLALLLTSLASAARDGSSQEDCAEGEEDCNGGNDDQQQTEQQPGLIAALTDEDFQETIKAADMMVVIFYAPWCHHCHEVLQLLDEVAEALKPHNIFVAKLDIEANKQTKNRYRITNVPEVTIFRNGLPHVYKGPSEDAGAQGIIDYILEEQKNTANTETVLTLTETNFDNIVNSSPLILVEFYADWCTACQHLEPHYVAAARRLRQEDPAILLGRVGVPDQLDLAERFTVAGYPLLIIFRNGKQYNYTGPKEEDGIVRYMKRQAGPSSKPLTSAQDVKIFSKSLTETRVVGFFSSKSSPSLIEAFVEAGNKVRIEMELGHCTDGEVAKELGYTDDSVVIYYPNNLVSKYESGSYTISKLPKNTDSIADLLLEHARPLVAQFTSENELRLFPNRPLLVAYFDVNWEPDSKKGTLYWHNLIASVAKDFKSSNPELSFAIANEVDFEVDMKKLGLSDWGDDIAVGIWAPGNTRYPMKEDLSADSLREFVQEFLNKQLKPHLNSEPPPKENKWSLVKTVVGSTFDKFVLNPTRNVLVKLCIPEDPDCKKAEEYFPKVAARYEGSDQIIFGEMNLNYNDLPPGITTNGELPSFLFSGKDSRDTVQVTPKPTDESDIMFFLKWRHSIRPTVREDEVERRAAARDAKRRKEKRKKEEKKKQQKKKASKDEL